jgi:hypothetical protein
MSNPNSFVPQGTADMQQGITDNSLDENLMQ